MTNDVNERSLALHRTLRGKIRVESVCPIRTMDDLSLAYTPGVGAVSSYIAEHPDEIDALTWRKNTVAVVSDGSAVLGLGNIGPAAALPVMEGKCAIFRAFANINAVPIVLGTQNSEEIIATVKAIAPGFGAIQLEDISAPRCFMIERRLQEELPIPVMHDDQHGTAIIVLAGLINALRITKKEEKNLRVVISGAGAAGMAIAEILLKFGVCDLTAVDRQGAIWTGRDGLNEEKKLFAKITNPERRKGSLAEVVKKADVFIGVSAPGVLTRDMVRSMAPSAIVFALANPVPEIMPEEAKAGGAFIIATGRGDFPNQINNALCYPGLFRGMLDKNVKKITDAIKQRAAEAIAFSVQSPSSDRIIPSIFDPGLVARVAGSV